MYRGILWQVIRLPDATCNKIFAWGITVASRCYISHCVVAGTELVQNMFFLSGDAVCMYHVCHSLSAGQCQSGIGCHFCQKQQGSGQTNGDGDIQGR